MTEPEFQPDDSNAEEPAADALPVIKSLSQHDYPVVQACLLMLAMAVMLGTLLGDVLQALMDPRVRAALA